MASEASKQLNEGDTSSLSVDLDELMTSINDQESERESINQVFRDKVNEQEFTDELLFQELEDMEKEQEKKIVEDETQIK